MNNLSKKTFIAIEAVLYIARNAGTKAVRSKEICSYQGVAQRYLEHVLQVLVHDGILKGVRGPKGGYFLSRDRRKIFLSDILDSVQSLISQEKEKESKSALKKKIIEPLWNNVNKSMKNFLSEITIQDLCEQAEREGISEKSDKKSDFII